MEHLQYLGRGKSVKMCRTTEFEKGGPAPRQKTKQNTLFGLPVHTHLPYLWWVSARPGQSPANRSPLAAVWSERWKEIMRQIHHCPKFKYFLLCAPQTSLWSSITVRMVSIVLRIPRAMTVLSSFSSYSSLCRTLVKISACRTHTVVFPITSLTLIHFVDIHINLNSYLALMFFTSFTPDHS